MPADWNGCCGDMSDIIEPDMPLWPRGMNGALPPTTMGKGRASAEGKAASVRELAAARTADDDDEEAEAELDCCRLPDCAVSAAGADWR